jgi:hypothetical protein
LSLPTTADEALLLRKKETKILSKMEEQQKREKVGKVVQAIVAAQVKING